MNRAGLGRRIIVSHEALKINHGRGIRRMVRALFVKNYFQLFRTRKEWQSVRSLLKNFILIVCNFTMFSRNIFGWLRMFPQTRLIYL